MPYEQALSLYSLGKYNDINTHNLNYLDQAMKIFKRIGATRQLEKVKRRKRDETKMSASLSFDSHKWKVKRAEDY